MREDLDPSTWDPETLAGLRALNELALDLRRTWTYAGDDLWRRLDAEMWERTHNAWAVLQSAPRTTIAAALNDAGFRGQIDELLELQRRAREEPTWFQRHAAQGGPQCIAYFSMEYMLSEALPIYSGGLGNVAGDQLKAASDLGVPVYAVGLLYQRGYFRQVIDHTGEQQPLFPFNAPGQLPITPIRQPDGEWLRMEIRLPGYSVWLRGWQAQVGRCRLLLLDSNDPANFPIHRGVTSELYGGDSELRLRQEMILGIGGWRLLRTLGLNPDVCHLNEGHAALAVLERARWFMEENNVPFATALTATRAGNLFTTHTAVPAGFDRFDPSLVERYLTRFAGRLGISIRELLALGRANANDDREPFNMAYLAIRGSGAINGVSQLHGEVSRRLFAPLFPHRPVAEVPIGHVTNGVHAPSWGSRGASDLWRRMCGTSLWAGDEEQRYDAIRGATDAELWQLRNDARHTLVEHVRRQASRERALAGEPAEVVAEASTLFDPDALTLGFARRFATYKRPGLLMHDPKRLIRLLESSDRPVQLVVAGKAHPHDVAGRAIIRDWYQFAARPEARRRVVWLSDYDMLLASRLVQGIDVWLNTPRRPWEASGTSGMKILVNGGLNLSELDGWWAEAYEPDVGWALGDGQEHGDDPAWDAEEANHLYDLLEQEVIPTFYDRNSEGIPTRWTQHMRDSMAMLTPRFSTDRTVRDYVTRYYAPAAEAYRRRAADVHGAADLAQWLHDLPRRWNGVRFDAIRELTAGGEHHFNAHLRLGDFRPDEVRVELYADASGDHPPAQVPASIHLDGDGYACHARVPAARPAEDYTLRVLPHREGVLPLEANWITWHR